MNTASRLSSSDAVDAGVSAIPVMRQRGASTPPARIAPASQGRSRRVSAFVDLPVVATAPSQKSASPVPEPR